MLPLILIGSVLLFYGILSYVQIRRKYKFAEKLAGPGIPFFGLLLEINGMDDEKKCEVMHRYTKQFPKLAKFWFGPALMKLWVHDPELLKIIFNHPLCLQKPAFYRFFGWGSGLVTADASTWRVHRKLLNSAFSTKVLQSFIPIFQRGSEIMVDKVAKHVENGEEFDIQEYTQNTTLDSICATSFGVTVDAQKSNFQFWDYMQRTHEIVSKRMFTLEYYSDLVFRVSPYYKEDQFVRKKCVEFGDELIEKRKKKMIEEGNYRTNNNNNGNNNNEEEEKFFKKPQILVDHLLNVEGEEGKHFTDSEIKDHVFTTISAGIMTTSLNVSFNILFLAMHPEIQERVIDEMKHVFYDESVPVDYENLNKLTYMDVVVKETHRLCPALPTIARETLGEIDLNGFKVPKGVDIVVNIWSLHRLEEHWGPDADKFNPDRFLSENSSKRHPYTFIPFSIGARNCIGQRYASLSIKVMLVNLLRAYKFRTTLKWEDIKWKFDVHLHITKPHWVSVEKRSFYDHKYSITAAK